MEVETMVLSDDGENTRTTVKRRQSSKRPNTRSFNWLRLGVGCLTIAFFAILAAVAILKTMPHIRKSVSRMERNEDTQEIVLKAMFSTTHILENEYQSIKIKNIDDITNQLNAKLSGNKIRVLNAFFLNQLSSEGYSPMICESLLSGNILQLNIITFYSRQCASQNENKCKIQHQEQLKSIFRRLLLIPVTIQFDNNRIMSIDMKICSLTDTTDGEEQNAATASPQRRKVKKPMEPIPMEAEPERNIPVDSSTPYMVLKKSLCSLNLGKIALVQMTGEHGSYIRDDVQTNGISNNEQNRQHITVTLYEDTTYRLHVQFYCDRQSSRDSFQSSCDLSQNVKAWIDFNDNGYDDDGESRVSTRSLSNNYKAGGTHDVEIYVPYIDDSNTKNGPHRMRLTVIPSEEYQRECGIIEYPETRDYTIDIVPKARYPVAVNTPVANIAYRNPPVANVVYRDPPVANLVYRNPPVANLVYRNPPVANIVYQDTLCTLNTAKIVLVLMAGEKGTQIRDDTPPNSLLNDYRSQHHMAVTIFEHTVYLIRIQLDCSWQLNRELFEKGCNLAQDVNLWIDLNDDGRYDESEIGAPYRWPITSYLPEGIYDLQIYVPAADSRYMTNRQHRMRIVVTLSDTYRRTCGRTDYNETRDYMVNIIPRERYHPAVGVTTPYMILSNLVCSLNIGKIIIVVMAGEHRTQIRDDPLGRDIASRYEQNQQHLAIILYEDTVYLLRIQLDCSGQWSSESYGTNCNLAHEVNVWIDLNGDDRFDDSENASPFRWPINSYTPQGVYDLQIYIPIIDANRMKPGPYRMRLVVTLNEQYGRKCDKSNYKETRDYTVSIVPNTRQPVDAKLPYLALRTDVCSLTNGKIVLVIMAGEKGTHIRDDIPTNIALSENQNRHHLAVTLNENTIYRLRIQLDCRSYSSKGPSETNCNLAQDVNVWIDFNNDGQFDQTESRVPHRWPLYSSMPLGIYDFEISIPAINEQNMRIGDHRMRIVVTPSEEYRKKCGHTDYSETREYTVNVVPRATYAEPEYRYVPNPLVYEYAEPRATYCSAGNLICADGNNAISLVKLFGEQRTEINDEVRTCNSVNNYNDRSNLVVTLFDNMVYTLHIELYCVQQYGYDNSYNQDPSLFETRCNDIHYVDVWIDFNNDGIFDESREQILSSNPYEDNRRATEYDLSITIPRIDGRNYLDGQHRMRIVVTSDGRNRKPCQNTGYGEVRDYTVQIIPKSMY